MVECGGAGVARGVAMASQTATSCVLTEGQFLLARPPPFCHLPAFAPAREGDGLARDEALRELGRAYGYAPCELPADALLCLFTKGAAKMEEFYDSGPKRRRLITMTSAKVKMNRALSHTVDAPVDEISAPNGQTGATY